MPKKKQIKPEEIVKTSRPGITPESRENQLIAAAINLAEKQLLEGTASSQVIVHYLKLGSTKEKIEREILEKQSSLIDAKIKSMASADNLAKICQDAIDAMKRYSGN